MSTTANRQSGGPPGTRAHRRERTNAAILEAARQVFADNGYQKATIRAVAERAGCDPALVMQHFGNKNGLFRAATALELDVQQAFAGPENARAERVLRHTFERLDEHADSIASTLRSMLTHDEIADEALKLFSASAKPEEAGDLRSELLMALTLGAAITRYVLKASAVVGASVDELLIHVVPAAEALYASPQPIATRFARPSGHSAQIGTLDVVECVRDLSTTTGQGF